MENLKEILYNNAKINSCEHIIKTYPFLEKTILEAMNQALHIHDVVGRSEQLSCSRNITTCVFYKDGSKCGNLEYRKDQTT